RGRSARAVVGEKNGFSARRHSRNSGGSISSGSARKVDAGMIVPCGRPGVLGSSWAEEKTSGRIATSVTWSYPVTARKPPWWLVAATGQRLFIATLAAHGSRAYSAEWWSKSTSGASRCAMLCSRQLGSGWGSRAGGGYPADGAAGVNAKPW